MRSFVVSSAVLALASVSDAGITPDLYGITYAGQLIGINASTGAGTLIGSTGRFNCESLERDPATGQLLMIASSAAGSGGRMLYRVNPETGASTLIGSSGYAYVEAMALNPITGVMYASASSNIDISAEKLVTLNLSTGAATLIANFGGYTDVDAMACSPAGVLYATQYGSNTLSIIDPLTAQRTVVSSSLPLYLGSMDFAPDGTLYASRLGDFNGGGGSSLRRIDPATGATTYIGEIGFAHVAGIVANIPGPSGAAALALAGLATVARRRR